MKKTIQKLKQKDQQEKERFAFIGALFITGFIVLFWLAGITYTKSDDAQMANISSPFNSLKNDLIDIFQQ